MYLVQIQRPNAKPEMIVFKTLDGLTDFLLNVDQDCTIIASKVEVHE